MTPREIKNKLEDKGVTQKALAAKIGCSAMAVSKVVNRQIVSDRIMKAIATAIGDDYRLVFGDYYLRPAKRKTSKVAAL